MGQHTGHRPCVVCRWDINGLRTELRGRAGALCHRPLVLSLVSGRRGRQLRSSGSWQGRGQSAGRCWGRLGVSWRWCCLRLRAGVAGGLCRLRRSGLLCLRQYFVTKLGNRLWEGHHLGRRVDRRGRRRDIVPAAQEREQLFVLLPREVGPNAHVCHDILVIEERALSQRSGVMALVAVHAENLAAGQRVLESLRLLPGAWNTQGGGASRQIDRRALTTERCQRRDTREPEEKSLPPFGENG